MKKFQFHLPRLRRRGKIVRNLLVTLFLLTLIWGQFLCPLFWPEWEFRRAERRLLLPPSEVVLHLDSPGGRIYREGQSRPILRDDHQFIGVGDGYAIAVALQNRPPLFSAPYVYVETWDLSAQEGAVKVIATSIASLYADWRREAEEGFLYTYLFSRGLVALDLPAGTVRGKLTVEEGAVREIANTAIKLKTGARGLRTIIESFMTSVMYKIPSERNVEEVIVTRDCIAGRAEPVIVYKKSA